MKFANEQDKERFEAAVSANILTIVDKGFESKYDHYGIYCIKVDGVIVYVGKSRNMLKRVAQHMAEIEMNTDKNMYNVLRELKKNHAISFDVLADTTEGEDDELGFAEAYAIRHHKPCLNIQYPKMDNYIKYDKIGLGDKITFLEVEKIIEAA